MSYRQPVSDIYLFVGVPFDKEYKHTLYSTEYDTTLDYLLDFERSHISKRHITELSYVDYDSGKVKIPTGANGSHVDEVLEDMISRGWNYMVINNFPSSLLGLPPRYCFIDDIVYVNDETVEISFTIDYVQTYLINGGARVRACFVEREHPNIDVRGSNIVPENFEAGDTVHIGELTISELEDNYSCVILSSVDFTGEKSSITNKYPMVKFRYHAMLPCSAKAFHYDNLEAVENVLRTLEETGQTNAILGVFMFPSALLNKTATSYTHPTKLDGIKKEFTVNLTNLDGNYVPRNKKLLTYPYDYVELTDTSAVSKIYRLEYFYIGSDSKISFYLTGEYMSGTPSINLMPYNYFSGRNVGANTVNPEERVSTNNFAQGSIATDTFKEWISANWLGLAMTGTEALVGGITSIATAAIAPAVAGAAGVADIMAGAGAGVSSATNIGGLLGGIYAKAKTPPTMHGKSSNAMDIGIGTNNLRLVQRTIKREYAEILDDYFSLYGYATMKVKVPNMTGRRYWNYCKTQGCNITGHCPNIAKDVISKAFDNGITFWSGRNGIIASYKTSDEAWYDNSPI